MRYQIGVNASGPPRTGALLPVAGAETGGRKMASGFALVDGRISSSSISSLVLIKIPSEIARLYD
jgi:hypothetical protein